MSHDRAMITVVAAVIERAGRLLVTRRLKETHLAGLWEFPGGKVADGESHPDALRREIREELDAGLDVQEHLLTTTHVYAERTVCLHFFRCILAGEPRGVLGQEMRWVMPQELDALEFPDADRELVELLRKGVPFRP